MRRRNAHLLLKGNGAGGGGISTAEDLLGHEGWIDGTGTIPIVSPHGAAGVVAAVNLADPEGARLPPLADDLLCPS